MKEVKRTLRLALKKPVGRTAVTSAGSAASKRGVVSDAIDRRRTSLQVEKVSLATKQVIPTVWQVR
jgi:hypothetical protein